METIAKTLTETSSSGARSESTTSPVKAKIHEESAERPNVCSPRRPVFLDAPPHGATGNGNGQGRLGSVSDFGFGFAGNPRVLSPMAHTPGTAPHSPMKSALRSPMSQPYTASIMSPTFREEQILDHYEKVTEKENARDLKIKIRVRIVKLLLRGVGFSCSLIILAMIGTRVYWTFIGLAFFIFSIVMWIVAVALFQKAKKDGNNLDLWGWACVDNTRRDLFEDTINYALVCRLQDWTLVCCIIEVVVDVITIAVYGVIIYRFFTKRRLRKSMEERDKARSQLWTSMARFQSPLQSPVSPAPAHLAQASPLRCNPPTPPATNSALAGQTAPVQYATVREAQPVRRIALQPPPQRQQPAPSE
ncbi:hypothetical protein KEM55_007045 [Ascosphaera atra]|nr:hypothetical protein KEM55_007045 [Ascosphaera atra]